MSEKTRGKFICIEGIDGCGKSTQIQMLKDRIKSECYFTREESDGPIGKLIREEYLSGKRKCDERVINMLYAADRLDHLTNSIDGIKKYLDEGINVICDRYYLSSMAYNSYMMETPAQVRESIIHTVTMNKYPIEELKPDLTIYIDLDIFEALRRIHSNRDEISVYEDTDKMVAIHNAYNIAIELVKDTLHDEVTKVDANGLTPTELNDLIYEVVCRYIEE